MFYKGAYTFQKALTINASGKNSFVINNSLGNIQFQKSSRNSIEIGASIKIAYNDYDYAKSVPDTLIKVNDGNIISLTSDRGQFQNDRVNVQNIDYIIKLPEKFNVEVINKFGRVEAGSIGGNLKIDNANGSDGLVQNDIKLEGRFDVITLNLNDAQEGHFNLFTRHRNIKQIYL